MKVAKNRLAKIALEGTDVASIGPLLKGPTVIAYSSDVIAAPKVATDFAKANEKFVILGGAMGNDRPGLRTASRRSPRCRRSTNCAPSWSACLVAPATKIAQLANAPAAKVARVIQAYASQGRSRVRLPVH